MSYKSTINRRDFMKLGLAATGVSFSQAAPRQQRHRLLQKLRQQRRVLRRNINFTAFPTDPQVIVLWGYVQRFRSFLQTDGIDGQFLGTVKDVDVAEAARIWSVQLPRAMVMRSLLLYLRPRCRKSLRKLASQKFRVVAINSKDFRPPEQRVPYIRYVGEDSYGSGFTNATKALELFQLIAFRRTEAFCVS